MNDKKRKRVSLLITLSSLIKVKQTSHANHTMRGLRYPRLILERLGFPLALSQTLQVLASSCLPQQIFNFSSNLLPRFEKTAKEFASDAQIHKNYSQNCKYVHYSSFWRNKLTK